MSCFSCSSFTVQRRLFRNLSCQLIASKKSQHYRLGSTRFQSEPPLSLSSNSCYPGTSKSETIYLKSFINMPKRKGKSGYNDFLEGEKLRDNAEVRTSLLQSSARQEVSLPPTRREAKEGGENGRSGAKKPRLTHFLCLPLINEGSRPQFERAMEMFKEEVQKEAIVPVKAVRPLGTLHLTLGVMSLDNKKLEGAEKCLEELDLKSMLGHALAGKGREHSERNGAIDAAAEHNPLAIEIKALVPMQQPEKTSILYAEPSDMSSRLYSFASALRRHFTEHGFLIEDKRPLKLHATIINTIYAKAGARQGQRKPSKQRDGVGPRTAPMEPAASEQEDETPTDPITGEIDGNAQKNYDRSEGHGPNAKDWMRFDARQIIERHRNTVWAEDVSLDRVQICKMGANKTLNEEGEIVDEKYEVVAEKVI